MMDELVQLIFDTITEGNIDFSDMCVNDVEELSSMIAQLIREKYYISDGLECKPYCTLLKECLEILAVFPFNSNEAQHVATKTREAISAIQETTFEKKYYEIRKELSEVIRQRDIEQGAWEETKKYQDEAIKEKKLRIMYQDILYKICRLFDKSDEKCNIHEVYDKVKSLLP